MAAYQANYGFTKEGEPDANNSAPSSSDPQPPKPNSKPPEKEKSAGSTPNPVPDQTSAKDPKQKGEKRKADPGKLISKVTNMLV